MKLCNEDWTEIDEDHVFSSVTHPHPHCSYFHCSPPPDLYSKVLETQPHSTNFPLLPSTNEVAER